MRARSVLHRVGELPPPSRPRDGPESSVGATSLAWTAVLGTAIVFSYSVLYPIKGIRVALGSDAPVYVWWARRAGALGLQARMAGGRPAVVATLAALADITRVPVAWLSAVIGPVLAAALGLATAAFVNASLGTNRLRFALTAVFTGTFLSLLVPGYFSTLAFFTLLLAALATLAWGIERDEWRPVVAALFLTAGAGLSHPRFLWVAAVLLTGGLVALVPSLRRDRAAGVPLARTAFGKTAVSFAGGAVLTGAWVLAAGSAPTTPVDTSRDAFLRRFHLARDTRISYRGVLLRFFPWYRALVVVPLAALPLVGSMRRTQRGGPKTSDRVRLFWGVILSWVALTAVAVVVLLAGVGVPGQRFAAGCIPLPLLAAVAVDELRRRPPPRRPALKGVAVGGLSALFLVVAWLGWGGEYGLIPPAALAEARAASGALAATSSDTPVVLIVNDRGEAPALNVTRYANYLRDAVPPSRIPDVHVFVGTVDDFLAGRPTLTGYREHDLLALDAWKGIRAALPRHPLAVVFEALDETSYGRAVRLPQVSADPARYRPGPGVVVLPGFTGRPAVAVPAKSGPAGRAGAGPMRPWLPVWLSPLVLLLLAAIGWPWARASLPSADRLLHAALAPGLGFAALGLAAMAVDTAGFRLAEGGGIIALALAAGGGLAAVGLELRRGASAARPTSLR